MLADNTDNRLQRLKFGQQEKILLVLSMSWSIPEVISLNKIQFL